MSYLPHPHRLKKTWEFHRVYKKGKKCWDTYFVVYVYHTQMRQTRLGITASKKVGKSVQRNRVKRLIREAFRMLKLELLPNYDIVVVSRAAACGLSMHQVRDSLHKLFHRASILRKTEKDI